jgi:hypothetical protein
MLIGSAHPGLHTDVYAAYILAEHLFEAHDYSLDQAIGVSAAVHKLTSELTCDLWQLFQVGYVRRVAV